MRYTERVVEHKALLSSKLSETLPKERVSVDYEMVRIYDRYSKREGIDESTEDVLSLRNLLT